MEEDVTLRGVYNNLCNHNGLTGKYGMTGAEIILVKPCVYRGIVIPAQPRADSFYCQECGTKVHVDDRYCRLCGQRLGE